MTDREKFIRAICERPEDDLPRLVFADWLEENGESERAKVIRDQIESGESETFGGLKRSGTEPHDWPWCQTYTIRRGFVSTVRCRLADWVGGERCARCHGTGEFEKHEHNYRCGRCSGTGRTPAHGPRIVAEQPVERAEVVDKRPWQNSLNEGPVRFTWLTTELVDARSAGNRDRLPPAIFEILYPRATYRGIVQAGFDSEAAAQSALSLALLNWARREAGLPPLRAVEVATV